MLQQFRANMHWVTDESRSGLIQYSLRGGEGHKKYSYLSGLARTFSGCDVFHRRVVDKALCPVPWDALGSKFTFDLLCLVI